MSMNPGDISPQILALAILERAIQDSIGKPAIAGANIHNWAKVLVDEIREETLEWFSEWCDEDLDVPGSFLWCCDTLRFDPSRLSKAVLTQTLPQEAHRQFGSYCKTIHALCFDEPYTLHGRH